MDFVDRFTISERAAFNRTHLLELRKDSRLKAQTHLVYVYELGESEELVNYPRRPGYVLYVGEACRKTLPSGGRFGQHVSSSLEVGRDPGSNLTLSQYYHLGKTLVLTIYRVSDQERKQREKDLLVWHLRTYGAMPIAQGASGENLTIVAVRDHPLKLSREVMDRHSTFAVRQDATQ